MVTRSISWRSDTNANHTHLSYAQGYEGQSLGLVSHRSDTEGQTCALTFTFKDNLQSPVNLHVFGLWKETEKTLNEPTEASSLQAGPFAFRNEKVAELIYRKMRVQALGTVDAV